MRIRAWNWSRRVTIHTIALSLAGILGEEKTDWGEDFMQQLASHTYGECRIVTKPPA